MERVDEYTPEDKAADEEALMKAASRPIKEGVPILNSAYPRAKGDEGDEESKLIENFAKSV